MPSTAAQSRPSAISFTVKSNSLRATKSIGAPCARLSVRLHGDLGADEADLQRRVGLLQRRRHLHVGGERRGRGVDHAQLEVPRLPRHRRRARCRPAARRSACCRAPARPAAPARSDTRTSGSRASPGSASRRRRRTRRTRAGAGTGSSSSRVQFLSRAGKVGRIRFQPLAAPIDLASGVARSHHGHRHKVSQRQKPDRRAECKPRTTLRQVRVPYRRHGRRWHGPPRRRRTRPATRPRPRRARAASAAQTSGYCSDRGGELDRHQRPDRARPAQFVAPQRAKVVSGTVVAGTVSASATRQPKPLDQPAQHVVVGQMVHQRLPGRRSAPACSRRSAMVAPRQSCRPMARASRAPGRK